MAATAYPLMAGQVLQSNSTRYTILQFIGEGGFGKVAKCWDDNSSKLVAVKILKKEYLQDVEDELSVLKTIGSLNADKINVVTFYEQFEDLGYDCLVFELLDVDLSHLVCPITVNRIRPIAEQLLVALQGLQSVRVMHRDIKPDNVMLANINEDPIRVKLVDFGMASSFSAITPGMIVQPIGYRAPEVCLGLPFSGAIDMWGLGCTLAFLYLNDHLFPVHCEYLMMKCMVEMLGMPSKYHFRFGMYSQRFFCKEDETGTRWRLLTPEEYSARNKRKAEEWPKSRAHFSSLDDLLYIFELGDAEEMEDRKVFIDFLKELLHPDGDLRISPADALQHPFITRSYLSQPRSQTAGNKMDDISPASGQYGHIKTHEPENVHDESPLSPANDQCGHCEALVAEAWIEDVPLSPVKLFPSSNGPNVEDVSFPTSHSMRFSGRFQKRVQKFFSRLWTGPASVREEDQKQAGEDGEGGGENRQSTAEDGKPSESGFIAPSKYMDVDWSLEIARRSESEWLSVFVALRWTGALSKVYLCPTPNEN
ncbi:homeodomain-interacting protein kinase 3-like [Gouania willdenowi]|uniref:homeodomain-interacting protein kinase 3-like n=1 Tax=Gouania willdenowi TaxID=441366 RepID=UPI00105642C2|nr:homeodomain-interacting protein kinase 3-like [Gouania willdenowi]